MSIEILLTLLLLLVIVIVFVLWFSLEKKDSKNYKKRRTISVYHCKKCNNIYSCFGNSYMQDCPKCGFKNNKLGF